MSSAVSQAAHGFADTLLRASFAAYHAGRARPRATWFGFTAVMLVLGVVLLGGPGETGLDES